MTFSSTVSHPLLLSLAVAAAAYVAVGKLSDPAHSDIEISSTAVYDALKSGALYEDKNHCAGGACRTVTWNDENNSEKPKFHISGKDNKKEDTKEWPLDSKDRADGKNFDDGPVIFDFSEKAGKEDFRFKAKFEATGDITFEFVGTSKDDIKPNRWIYKGARGDKGYDFPNPPKPEDK
jgi:hypothetical protein